MNSRRAVTDAVLLLAASAFSHLTWLAIDLAYPTTDLLIHYRWAAQFAEALGEGIAMPGWAPYGRGGLGEPVFVYYMPLFYYAVAAVDALVGDVWLSIKLVTILSGIATGWVLMRFARDRGLPEPLVAAVGILATASPVLLAVRGLINSYPWFAATAFVALGMVAFVRLVERGNGRDIAEVALWVGLAALTHTLSAAVMLIALAGGCLSVGRAQFWATGFRAALAVGLGLAFSAMSLGPALMLLDLVSPEAFEVTAGVAWWNSWVYPLVTPLWRLGICVVAPTGPVLLTVLLVFAIVAARSLTPARRAMVGATATAAALCFEVTYPLWAALEPLQMMQRPFRFLVPWSVATLVALVLLAPAAIRRWGEHRLFRPAVWGVVAANLLLGAALQADMARKGYPVLPRPLSEMFFTPEHLPATAGPGWEQYGKDGGWEAECARLDADCEGGKRTAHHFRWTVTVEQDTGILLPLFGYPGWQIESGDAEVAIDPDTGLLKASLPPGSHVIEARWKALPLQITSRWISAAALGVIILLWALNPVLASGRSAPRDAEKAV